MPTDTRQKRPSEIIEFGVDFTSRLLGETLITGNTDITVANALTDADATATILVSGSKTVSGNVLSGKFQAGADKDLYTILFKTGNTTLSRKYEKSVGLEVTLIPDTDNLLATRDEVKRVLRIPDTDISDHQLLDEILLGASKYLRSRCAREFALQTYIERVYSRDHERRMLRLAEWPIVRVDKIVRYLFDGTVVDTITDQSLYKWDFDSSGEVFFTDGTLWHDFPDYQDITYRAGYLKIPDDLRDACKSLVAWLYSDAARQGVNSERIGDYSYVAARAAAGKNRGELPIDQVESIIGRFRRPDFAYMP